MRLDDYAEKGTKKRSIIDLHFEGYPPSEIDKELELAPGDAKKTVLDYWRTDDAWHYHEKHSHRVTNNCV